MTEQQGFLISRQWRDTPAGVELCLWLSTERGAVELLVEGPQPVFFLAAEELLRAKELLLSVEGWRIEEVSLADFSLQPVVACYFISQRLLRNARELLLAGDLNPLESDINPCDRFLMERFVRGALAYNGDVFSKGRYWQGRSTQLKASEYQPAMRLLSIDIETAMQGLQLFSIAAYADDMRCVFMVGEAPADCNDEVIFCDDERLLLIRFLAWVADYDPDIIIGWNVVNFDLWFLQRLCEKYRLKFSLGRDGSAVYWRQLDDEGYRRAVSVAGRVVLDGIEVLKAATYSFESFSLQFVSSALLNDSKLLSGDGRGDKITELFHNDKQALAAYNIQDCKLVWEIFQQEALLDFLLARSRMTGLPLDRIGGSVASFDFRYLPLLHRQGFVAPNGHWLDKVENSPGGFVMESRPGIYEHVLVLDFKSLYPSIIRTFKIDPMAMAIALHSELDQAQLVPGFRGGWFAKQQNVLPGLIAELWQARDIAKSRCDQPLSQAIKILMNSFYGVLGAAGCRFFDPRLASSITRRGHQIIQQTAEYIESRGWRVIYGDTDSVFVWVNGVQERQAVNAIGVDLAADLNRWWKERLANEYAVESALEIEFETHFLRFLMPTIRGSEQGSKKRYAGVIDVAGVPELVFKGLETVRSDWTPLARNFQRELYRRVFFEEPYREYIVDFVRATLAGEHDAELVCRKRLRRKLGDYQRNVPPHVKAARLAVAAGAEMPRRGDWVEYLLTSSGPEPVSAQQSPVDYQSYIDRQLAPVADGILHFLGTSLGELLDQQLSMF